MRTTFENGVLATDSSRTAEEVGHKKTNLGAGQQKLAGSFVMTHRS